MFTRSEPRWTSTRRQMGVTPQPSKDCAYWRLHQKTHGVTSTSTALHASLMATHMMFFLPAHTGSLIRSMMTGVSLERPNQSLEPTPRALASRRAGRCDDHI